MRQLLGITIVLAAIALFVPGSSSAQSRVLAGGQLGISSSESGRHGGSRQSTSTFSINPEFGYLMNNDRWILGLRFSYSHGRLNTDTIDFEGYGDWASDNCTTIGLNPFAMYHCLNAGPVELWFEGSLSYDYAFNKGETPGGDHYYDANVLGAHVLPVIAWRPFRHFSFYTELNFLSLGYSYTDVITEGVGTSASTFSFGIDSYSFLKISDITVGFRYWF